MTKIVQYEHHGAMVSVRADLKGRHRECCLCFQCANHDGCTIAAELYEFAKRHGTVHPMWECPQYEGV